MLTVELKTWINICIVLKVHNEFSFLLVKLMSEDCIVYHIDDQNRIVHVSDHWQSFADENAACTLTEDAVLNRSIFDFLSDQKVKHLYKMLIDRARNEKVRIRLPFRCDSPNKRRYMAMEVYPLDNGMIVMKSYTLKEETREPVALLDSELQRISDFITICSWCKRVRDNKEHWLEVEDAVEQMGMFDESALPQLSHGMCNDCYEKARTELDYMHGPNN